MYELAECILYFQSTILFYLAIPVLNKNYCSLNKAKVGSQQWRKAQESLLGLEKRNAASVDTIVR